MSAHTAHACVCHHRYSEFAVARSELSDGPLFKLCVNLSSSRPTHTHTHTHTHIHACTHTHTTHAHTQARTDVHITQTRTHINTHTYTQTSTHAKVYTKCIHLQTHNHRVASCSPCRFSICYRHHLFLCQHTAARLSFCLYRLTITNTFTMFSIYFSLSQKLT